MSARTPPLLPVLAAVAFLALLGLVAGDWAPLDRADLAVSDRFREYGAASPDTVAVVRVLTDVMSTLSFLAIGLATTALLLAAGRRRDAGFCAAVVVAVPLLWGAMHAALHRPRPADGFVVIDSNGFPSGHTSHAAATAVVAVLLLWPRLRAGGRVAAVILAVAFAAAIGLTRVALLAHWPSDVLGGWLLALAVVPALALALRRVPVASRSSPPRPRRRQKGSPVGRDS